MSSYATFVSHLVRTKMCSNVCPGIFGKDKVIWHKMHCCHLVNYFFRTTGIQPIFCKGKLH